MIARTFFAAAAVAALLATAAPGAGQPIAVRVATVDAGWVTFSFAARDGLCRDHDGGSWLVRSDDPVWEPEPERCVTGPVRVSLRVVDGRVVELDTHVGGRWRTGVPGLVDLGLLEPEVAVDYLLGLARTAPGEVGEDAVFPASHAHGVEPWPRLLAIARDPGIADDTREGAIFWLGHAAGEKIAGELGELAYDDSQDLEIREAAIFALSQLDDEERAVDELVGIVRTARHPRLVEKALFWLADTESPRAIEVLEEILLER